MADVVYWGNNSTTAGEYTAPKEVASVAIVQLPGGIKVDWGGGDVDILPGTSWGSSSAPPYWDYCFVGTVSVSGCKTGYTVIYREVFDVVPIISLDFRSGQTGTCTLAVKDVRAKFSFDGGATWKIARFSGLTPPTTAYFPSGGAINWHGSSVGSALPGLYSKTGIPPVYTIQSNGGGVSRRNTTTPPNVSVLSGGCAVAIAYADSSTEQIPLSECYQWARFRDDQECPEGTCTVDCGDHRCCYDPNTGIAVKVIPL